jgi:sterol desaturase/sphingolipid hydroxylase (fatty acid hydroxylase superfamily)
VATVVAHPIFWETVALLGAIAVFDTWERRRPGYAIDRRHHLRLNIAALVVVIVFSEAWKVSILATLRAVDLASSIAWLQPVHSLPSMPKMILLVALVDLMLYAVHRAMHASDLLWRTHAFHHTTEHLHWLSGSRTSVTHLFLFAGPQIFVVYFLVGATPAEAAVAASIGVLVNIWVHTNLKVDLGPVGWLLITPDYHRVHHAADSNSRKNLGFVFTIWDRMFGTYVDPRTLADGFRLGLSDERAPMLRRIVGV